MEESISNLQCPDYSITILLCFSIYWFYELDFFNIYGILDILWTFYEVSKTCGKGSSYCILFSSKIDDATYSILS